MLDRLVGLQGEPGAVEDGEEGHLRRPRADRGAPADRRARARYPRVQAGRSTGPSRRCSRRTGQQFTAKLHHIDGKKAEIPNQAEAAVAILTDLKGRKSFERHRGQATRAPQESVGAVHDVHAPAGSREEAVASARSGRCASRRISTKASSIGTEGAVGLITYMRTDSTRVAESAATTAREYLRVLFGEEFLADGPAALRRRQGEEHPGRARERSVPRIRRVVPTRSESISRRISSSSTSSSGSASWRRRWRPRSSTRRRVDFDMPAKRRSRDIGRRSYLFRATGSIVKFQGFLALYREAHEEGEHEGARGRAGAARRREGRERFPVSGITPTQHFTEPPPRFSEASLVKELERLGIGRPSTYASIISVLVDRRYVELLNSAASSRRSWVRPSRR